GRARRTRPPGRAQHADLTPATPYEPITEAGPRGTAPSPERRVGTGPAWRRSMDLTFVGLRHRSFGTPVRHRPHRCTTTVTVRRGEAVPHKVAGAGDRRRTAMT